LRIMASEGFFSGVCLGLDEERLRDLMGITRYKS